MILSMFWMLNLKARNLKAVVSFEAREIRRDEGVVRV